VKTVIATTSIALFVGMVGASLPPSPEKDSGTPEALKAEIEALRPSRHVWREIGWNSCLLEGLKEARARKKPVMLWAFINGNPDSGRC
jgi:hypothetical protein